MLERLHAHLAMLRREGSITDWYDRDILAGALIDREISSQLESAQLLLALVSPDFLASPYCYEKEMTRAIARHEAGQMVIVPVILEPCDWLSSPLKQFKAVPRDGKPISKWPNQNEAFLDVVNELRRLVGSLSVATKRPATTLPPTRPPAAPQTPMTSKYRLKKTFDRIARDDFRTEAFEVIRRFFEDSAKELDGSEGVRARYHSMGATAFTCTVVNPHIKSGRTGEGHITVHASRGTVMLGDIHYSFAPSAPENTAQGSFVIECDDYELFLMPGALSSAERNRRWYPQEVAARLWGEFLQQAGIGYA